MKKRYILLCVTAVLLLSLTGCGHTHKWEDATCTAPKTCVGCGESEGEKNRHNVPEDGICTICKHKQDNVLTLEPKARPNAPVVYGGVFLRSYLYSDAYGNMFPGQYTIHAEDGTAIAAGDWGRITFVETGPSSGKSPDFADTAYIPLRPGNYKVAFTYYTKYACDDIVTNLFVPVGEPISVNYNFIVR